MFEYRDIIDYLSIQIDILFLTKVRKESLRMTPSLKLFFIFNIILNIKGVDISSIDAAEQLRNLMGCKNCDKVYSYRNKLKKQGWITENTKTKRGYTIHPLFHFESEAELFKEKTYKFSIKCTEQNLNNY